jgi:hypothetical protein
MCEDDAIVGVPGVQEEQEVGVLCDNFRPRGHGVATDWR